MPNNPDSQDPREGVPDLLKVAGSPGLLVIGQAAAYLGITEDQVAGFVQDGELRRGGKPKPIRR